MKICALVFVAAFVGTQFDEVPSEWIHRHTMAIDPVLQILTKLGDGYLIIPLCVAAGLILYFKKSKYHVVAWLALTSFIASGVVAQILKLSLGRPRPFLAWDSRFPGIDFAKFSLFKMKSDFSSFPSGHATTLFAISWVAFSLRISQKARIAIFCFAVLGAMSRVALAKHFICDVFAAAAVGILVSQFILAFYENRIVGRQIAK